MHVAEISKPIRTRLGFHIVQLTDRKQARRMTFDEARGEIGLTLENENVKRPCKIWRRIS